MCAQRRFRSDCAFAQSDQNLHWARFDSQGSKMCKCGQRKLLSDCVDAQADLSLCLAHMSDGTFLHVLAHIVFMGSGPK